MRITATIDIDDDLLAAAKALADRTGASLGRALSELARRGLRRASSARAGEDGTVFRVSADAAAITTEDVEHALGDWP